MPDLHGKGWVGSCFLRDDSGLGSLEKLFGLVEELQF